MQLANALLLTVLLASLIGTTPAPAAEAKRLEVVTSILPIYCLATQVAGNLARVTNLTGAEADAHDHQFTPRERRLIESADVILINGLGLEPWLNKAAGALGPGRSLVECSTGLESELIFSPANPARPNPHVWLDPVLARQVVTNILKALVRADPRHAADYAAGASACCARLERLHADIQQALSQRRGSPIVTQHDSFAYFARRYGLRVVGLVEEIADVDPTPRHLSALRATIREQGVKVIFAEPGASARRVNQLGRDLGVRVALLDSLEGGAIRPEAYEQRMRKNLSVLTAALEP